MVAVKATKAVSRRDAEIAVKNAMFVRFNPDLLNLYCALCRSTHYRLLTVLSLSKDVSSESQVFHDERARDAFF